MNTYRFVMYAQGVEWYTDPIKLTKTQMLKKVDDLVQDSHLGALITRVEKKSSEWKSI